MKALLSPAAGNRIYIARITEVETVAALARKKRDGHITPADATAAVRTLENEVINLFRVVEVAAGIFAEAKVLAQRHFLRGYDAVQLAAALEANAERTTAGLPSLTLIAADLDLNTAGTAEGLAIDDPNTH